MPRRRRIRTRSTKLFGDSITLRESLPQEALGDEPYGYWAPATGEIVIRRDQPWIEKHIVLIHEFLHAADDVTRSTRKNKRLISHEAITVISPVLLMLFTEFGLWRSGPTKAELRRFARAHARGGVRITRRSPCSQN